MARRGVIQDSDDEDGGFSPLKSDHPSPICPAEEDLPDAATASTTRSTDPAYFDNVYADQTEQASLRTDTDGLICGDALINFSEHSSFRPGSLRDESKGNNSSSITDPIVASRRKKTTSAKDFESITQVTTPGKKSSGSVDPYAIPSSPLEEHGSGVKSRKTKTYGKKTKNQRLTPAQKRLQSPGEGHVSGTYAHDNSSRGSAKRRRISEGYVNVSHATEDVDLVLVPRTDYANAPSAPGFQGNENSSSMVYDTLKMIPDTANEPPGASFYIAQNQLSASQKLQYQPITFSSDHDPEGPGVSLPTKSIASQIEQRSSDDATIAYTTPSRFGSSNAHIPSVIQPQGEEVSSALISLSIKKRAIAETGHEPNSSPDILTDYSPHQRQATRAQDMSLQEAISQDVDLSDRVRGRERKRRSSTQDVSQELEEMDIPLERYVPRPSRRRSAATNLPDTQLPDATDENTELAKKQDHEPILISSGHAAIEPTVVSELPQPKKRGRKKKPTLASEEVENQQHALEGGGDGGQALTMDTPAPVKRKRGRPKKGEKPPRSLAADQAIDERNEETIEDTTNIDGANENIVDLSEIEDGGLRGRTSPKNDSLQDDDQPRQQGRRKKRVAEAKPTLDSPEPVTSMDKGILKDISNIGTSPLADEKREKHAEVASDKSRMEEKETIEKDASLQAAKMAASNSQLSKVTYRVGLSKRSRIAPLLKSLRK